MTEVRPEIGQSQFTSCFPQPRETLGKDAARQPSFVQLFELHWAIEEMISAAARDGSSVSLSYITEKLLLDSSLEIAHAELQRAIMEAAAHAGVRVCSRL
jgi:hypothetical protein